MSDTPERIHVRWGKAGDTRVTYMEERFWPPDNEAEYIRADVSASRIADLERQLAEARAEAEQAVALAYQRAAAKMQSLTGWDDDHPWVGAILALAPADALADVERMRNEIRLRKGFVEEARDERDAAEAGVARLREALITARQVVYQSSIDRTQPEDAEAALRMIDAAIKGDTP